MIKRLLKNKKGVAEVIGSVMFIVILLFFFTNVYLWHDAATKEMNDLYLQKINSPITISVINNDPHQLNVTNKGGLEAKLSILWVNAGSTGSSDRYHGYFNLEQQNKVVSAGSSIEVTWNDAGTLNNYNEHYSPQTGDKLKLTIITNVGNTASCNYP